MSLSCRNYKEEFIPAAGHSGLTLSSQISAVGTVSMMICVGFNVSQLRILVVILQNKLGAKIFQSEYC